MPGEVREAAARALPPGETPHRKRDKFSLHRHNLENTLKRIHGASLTRISFCSLLIIIIQIKSELGCAAVEPEKQAAPPPER